MIIRFYRKDSDYYVEVNGITIKVNGTRPIDYLLVALVYGLGVRFIDKYGVDEYVINCEIANDELRCDVNCSGFENRCLVYRLLTRGSLMLRCLTQS
ncbi:hypothetical protein [Vulcanisaeta souniana]|uniref:Uncharacterized protein n=1 Tax=Vulcanisaeta souniana JCM 11219 TaxID=1293586 RepID=A0A830EK66_9CREN|nr:hypothetical protein [Vulcanisaeta souniana]BDR91285.1 hypothetical protein Vsou_03780 [Vulcanisaeta souniana JCM 11219]GGI84888.1 hypothetical protein GCM10007112_22290 [Vulcanisaeta souniana JCM 11219]